MLGARACDAERSTLLTWAADSRIDIGDFWLRDMATRPPGRHRARQRQDGSIERSRAKVGTNSRLPHRPTRPWRDERGAVALGRGAAEARATDADIQPLEQPLRGSDVARPLRSAY